MEQNLNMLKRKFTIISIGVGGFCLIAGLLAGSIMANPRLSKEEEKILETYNFLKENWWFATQHDDIDQYLCDLAIHGMTDLNSDSYTFYTDNMENQNLAIVSKGIGISHTYYGGNRRISNVYEDSPAQKADLHSGDVILGIYESSTSDLFIDFQDYSMQEVLDLFTNYTADEIKLKILKSGEIEPIDIALTKDIFTQNSLTYDSYQLNDEVILDVKIQNFLDQFLCLDFYSALTNTIKEFEKIDKLIIDLTDNGGGYVSTAVNLASYFLPKNATIMQVKYPDGEIVKQLNPYEPLEELKDVKKINIIQNKSTASASELFILALKDNLDEEKLDIIGTHSYGKGIMQGFYQFEDGSVFRYTNASTLSPNGYSIHDIGINPTITKEYDNDLIAYYGEVGFVTHEYKEHILNQINLVLGTHYDNYEDGLSNYLKHEGINKETFDYEVGRLLQKQGYDKYIEYQKETHETAKEV